MARLKSYPQDTTLSAGDRLIGTDEAFGANSTQNFSLGDLKRFISIGLGGNIPDLVPSGFISGVSHDNAFYNNNTGNVNENSFIRFKESDVLTTGAVTFTSATKRINLSLNGDGSVTMDFILYYDKYVLNTFQNLTFTLTDTNAGTLTGTFGTLRTDIVGNDSDQHPFGYNNEGEYYYSVNVTLDNPEMLTQTYTNIDSVVINGTPSILSYELFDLDVTGNINVTGSGTIGGGLVVIGDTDLRSNLNVDGNQQLDGNLTVDGNSQFNSDITLGDSNPNTNPVNINLHGTLHIEDEEGGITFGAPSPQVSLTTDGDNLSVSGGGNWTQANDTNFTGGLSQTDPDGSRTDFDGGVIMLTGSDGDVLTIDDNGITRVDINGNPLPGPVVVAANSNASGTNQGNLTLIQIGSNTYNIPIASTGVAEALPGVSEELGGLLAADAGNVVTFFYGTDQGQTALYQSQLAAGAQPSATGTNAITLAANDVTGTIPTGIQTAFNTAHGAIPSGQRIFFVMATLATRATGSATDDSSPTAGNMVSPTLNVYEVISYNNTTRVFRFGRVGGGVFVVATEEIRFPNISRDDNAAYNFVKYDTADGSIHHSQLNIDGQANGARLDLGSTILNVAAEEIQFQPERQTSLDAATGTGTVDLSGRGFFGGFHTTSTTAQAFAQYLLGPNAAQQTITLPSGNVGDWVDITNQSTFLHNTDGSLNVDASGDPQDATSAIWRIIPAASERINGLNADEELTLDNAKASFRLTYSGSAIGWLITGTE